MSQVVKQYNGLNIVKFIMAFAVVAIHVRSSIFHGDAYDQFTNWFIRLAVPFFFISSGYLTKIKIDSIQQKDNSNSRQYLSIKSKKFAKIFIYWLLIYFPFSLIYFIQTSTPVISCIKYYIFSIILKGETYLSWPLWYVYSSAICYFLLSRFKVIRNQVVIWLLLAGIILLFIADYCEITSTFRFSNIISGVSGRGLGGLAYIVIGMLLGNYLDKLRNTNLISLISVISSFILYINNSYIFALFGGLGLTILALKFTPPTDVYFKYSGV